MASGLKRNEGSADGGGTHMDRFDYSPVKSTLKTASSFKCRKTCDWQKLAILILFCTTCLTFGGAILLWTTNVADSIVLNSLIIKNGTQIYNWWRDPPVETFLKLRLFNYTNAAAYLNGTDRKLHVQELGPYVYRSTRVKEYIEFDDSDGDEIVTFQDNRSYEFVPEMSPGVREDDPVTVPNMALLGAASVMHDAYYIVRMGLATILKGLKVEPFLHLTAKEFLWGYDDTLFDLAKTVVPFQKELPFERFGIMASINGLSRDRISIHTGLHDPKLLGVISKYNGETSLPYWGDYECNRVDGSEGTIFPHMSYPKNYNFSSDREKTPPRIYVFNHELCRRLPFEATESVTAHGFPAIRFRPPEGVFDDAITNPDHKCFCDPATSVCPPSGVFNVTPCAYGAPIMASFPHFYTGDPSLLEPFEGLNPTKEDHEFYLDIQPTLGIPMGGRSRLQMNAMVRRPKGIWQLDGFPRNIILPISWFEIVVEELPDFVKSAIRLVTDTAEHVQHTVMVILFILSIILFITTIGVIMRRIFQSRKTKNVEKGVSANEKPEMTAFLDRNG